MQDATYTRMLCFATYFCLDRPEHVLKIGLATDFRCDIVAPLHLVFVVNTLERCIRKPQMR